MISLRSYEQKDYVFVQGVEDQVFHSMNADEFSSYYLENEFVEIDMILQNNNVIGYIVIWLDLDKSQIYSMYIKEQYRQQNFGYQALLLIQEKLVNLGVKDWTLEVRKSNQAAIKLYQKIGFKIVVSRNNYYRDHEDAWLMIKRLNEE